jgi:hypothetical protein
MRSNALIDTVGHKADNDPMLICDLVFMQPERVSCRASPNMHI